MNTRILQARIISTIECDEQRRVLPGQRQNGVFQRDSAKVSRPSAVSMLRIELMHKDRLLSMFLFATDQPHTPPSHTPSIHIHSHTRNLEQPNTQDVVCFITSCYIQMRK